MAPRRHPAWPSSRPTASRMRAAGCRTMSCSHGTLARSRSPAAYADQHTAPIRLTGGGFVLAAPKRKDPRPLPSADLFHCCTTAIPHHQYHLYQLLHNRYLSPVPPPFTVASIPPLHRHCICNSLVGAAALFPPGIARPKLVLPAVALIPPATPAINNAWLNHASSGQ